MAKLPARLWQEMTTADFAALDKERTIAVLPVAAIEQHGPHLPLSVDACINQGIIDEVLRRLPEDVPATFLPLMPIGKSNEHIEFPGTLTFSHETLIRGRPSKSRSHCAAAAFLRLSYGESMTSFYQLRRWEGRWQSC